MKKIALCYDFDGTLCSGYMQDQKLLHDCKIEPKDFWIKVINYAKQNQCDPTLTYLMLLEQPVDDILSDMLHRLDPKEFKQFMNIIDDFIINGIGIKKERIPWLNETNEREEWLKLINLVRLSVAKVLNEFDKKNFKETTH